jgi:hypothetical protein
MILPPGSDRLASDHCLDDACEIGESAEDAQLEFNQGSNPIISVLECELYRFVMDKEKEVIIVSEDYLRPVSMSRQGLKFKTGVSDEYLRRQSKLADDRA